MKTRIIIAVLFVAMIGTLSAFATGQAEKAAPNYGPKWRGPDQPRQESEKITATGQVYFKNLMHPELKSGDKEYELMVPRFAVDQVDLKEGQTITIEGYTFEDACYQEGEEDVHVMVTKATIDGKEYDLSDRPFGMFGGHRPGMGRPGNPWMGRGPGMMGHDVPWGGRRFRSDS